MTSKLEDLIFFVVEDKIEILLGHPVSDRLDLTQMLCHNKDKWQVSAVRRSDKHASKTN